MFWDGRRSFTKMVNPQYKLIAQAYGIAYDVVLTREELAEKVERMLNIKGPYLLECAIKEEDNVFPMTPPGKSVNEMQLTMLDN
jgi:acetolactate synthase-1/2/3 large subunit